MIPESIRRPILSSRLSYSDKCLCEELDKSDDFDLVIYKSEVYDLLFSSEKYLLGKLNEDVLLLKSIEKDVESVLLGIYNEGSIINKNLLEEAILEVGKRTSKNYSFI